MGDIDQELQVNTYPKGSKIKMVKFEEYKTYTNNFIGDAELFFDYSIARRTDKFAWIIGKNEREIKRVKIHIYNDVEYVYPMGRYSMAPVLKADKEKFVPYFIKNK